MNVLQALRETADQASNNIPKLNYGGCGVYAAAVATALAGLNIPVHGVVERGWDDSEDLEESRLAAAKPPRTVLEWNKVKVHFRHVLVVARIADRWWIHDSQRTLELVNDHPGDGYIRGKLTLAELRNVARCRVGWNTSFDRRRYLRSVKSVTQKYLSPSRKELAVDGQLSLYF